MKSRYAFILSWIILISWVFSSCSPLLTAEEMVKKEVFEYYKEKFGFSESEFYGAYYKELDEGFKVLLRWELDENKVESYSEIFYGEQWSERVKVKENTYLFFELIFDQKGRVHQIGFLDDLNMLSGDLFYYEYKDMLTKKRSLINDHRFYEVIYTLDYYGEIVDSLFQFFPIVSTDKNSFEGPYLSICFDVRLIIDKNQYNFKDFTLWYDFYDIKDLDELPEAFDYAKIHEGILPNSMNGHYRFCNDLELNYHLFPVIGFNIDTTVFNQKLRSGVPQPLIVNRNLESVGL